MEADFPRGRETGDYFVVILSKTAMQKERSLKGISLSDCKIDIGITTTEYISIRLTVNNELYGYDISIPPGEDIYPEKTEVKAKKDTLEIKVYKKTNFEMVK
ncbi:uncharacterized protein LOC125658142 isoform X2 [Ostrea edulis]|uniref:uncharacterized protein LOC125658142 isoform X2 n=1 Tax=Ostrea edulis TaxID=37623 RepID=UPI0024AF7501|nr:uncharacterized protein LOC125658142 isoform X2 [Ostrea edulis]